MNEGLQAAKLLSGTGVEPVNTVDGKLPWSLVLMIS
jgi:hypothetical protein